MEVKIVKCKRCGHKWATRMQPNNCTKCNSPYWDKPRIRTMAFCDRARTRMKK